MKNTFGIVCLGTVLTAVAVVEMYAKRGGFAIGGEWFLAPLLAGLYDAATSYTRK